MGRDVSPVVIQTSRAWTLISIQHDPVWCVCARACPIFVSLLLELQWESLLIWLYPFGKLDWRLRFYFLLICLYPFGKLWLPDSSVRGVPAFWLQHLLSPIKPFPAAQCRFIPFGYS